MDHLACCVRLVLSHVTTAEIAIDATELSPSWTGKAAEGKDHTRKHGRANQRRLDDLLVPGTILRCIQTMHHLRELAGWARIPLVLVVIATAIVTVLFFTGHDIRVPALGSLATPAEFP